MLFVVEYQIGWETLEAAIAKRLEWGDSPPDGFRYIGEYIWQDADPPFRGVAIIEADSVEAINGFVLHYGPTLKMRAHPASDVAKLAWFAPDELPERIAFMCNRAALNDWRKRFR